MLDSKTLDFTRRLIQADIKKHRESFYKELSQTKRKLQHSGNSPETSSRGKKIIFELFTQELEVGASIAWRNLQRAHKALGAQITETLASNLKEAMTHFLSEITKELLELMVKQPCFAKDGSANSNLYLAENGAREKINIEIELYASNLMQKSKKLYQTKAFKGAEIALVVTLLGGGIPAWLSIGNKTDDEIVKKLEEQVQKTKAHLTHQLVIQPMIGLKDELGYPFWSVILYVTNTGPATAKLSRTSLQYPVNREIKLHSPPRLTSKPVTGQAAISGTLSRGWYDIALSNLSINDGFAVQADLLVSENIREKITKGWKMNDANFVRQFIFLVSTSGENIEPEYNGLYPIPTLPTP